MLDVPGATMSLWGKKGKPGEMGWLPLPVHMADAAGIAGFLWDRWLSDKVRHHLAVAAGGQEEARALLIFLAACHDLGKTSPVFQAKQRSHPADELDIQLLEGLQLAGLPCDPFTAFRNVGQTPHALVTQQVLLAHGCDSALAAILGAHHGKPVDAQTLMNTRAPSYPHNYHMGAPGKPAWQAAQAALLAFALRLSGHGRLEDLPRPGLTAQVLLTGLVTMADWLASNEKYFPYLTLGQAMPLEEDLTRRAADAWERLALPQARMPDVVPDPDQLYSLRFAINKPHQAQLQALDIARGITNPGILVLEAPMGSGKTEAALACAEVFLAKTQGTGLLFALPTQATSNAMFDRLHAWTQALSLGSPHSIKLAHGKAQFNEEYSALMAGSRHIGEGAQDAVVHQWFEGNKKSMLADFVAGTIDQFLLAALRQRHVMLRHLGLAGKVVILDECHAYDAYMNRYLDQALSWMGAYGVPVIILSATLPASRRSQMIRAYLGQPLPPPPPRRRPGQRQADPPPPSAWTTNRGYPLLTWTDQGEVRQQVLTAQHSTTRVLLERLPEEDLVDRLRQLLAHGGCAGLVVNTVKRAQDLAQQLMAVFGADRVTLVHSRFVAPDRARLEEGLVRKLGRQGSARDRQGPHIVVGTQVIEQSLDLDFDVLVSDFCPMDLLLQRMGRLHRHPRARPRGLEQARCLLLNAQGQAFEPGAQAIYQAYPLMRTQAILPQDNLVLPEDIPKLVQEVYDQELPLDNPPVGYEQAREQWNRRVERQGQKAAAYLLRQPGAGGNLIGLLSQEHLEANKQVATDARGEAAVRDAADSLEVQLICRFGPDSYGLLPWSGSALAAAHLPGHQVPTPQEARELARHSLRLPPAFCHEYVIDQTIRELEEASLPLAAWQQSPWLKGLLFLVLDEELRARLGGRLLRYSKELGLLLEEEKELL